jgi:UDP-N-acetyl-2-amino-2-deoxyglucuronate dehydrogenase
VKKLNFGIIGCGRIAYKHAEAIKKNEKANLLYVCDIIEERAVDYKNKYGAENICDLLVNHNLTSQTSLIRERFHS